MIPTVPSIVDDAGRPHGSKITGIPRHATVEGRFYTKTEMSLHKLIISPIHTAP